MITGEIKNQVDSVWNAFWTGGTSNPLLVIEQLTYLLFLKGLDDTHTAREQRARLLGQELTDPVFGEGMEHFRWKAFKDLPPTEMYDVLVDKIFPWMRGLGGEHSAFADHMRDARFALPRTKAALLASVVEILDQIPMQDRDTKGDLYEYLLSKLSSAGTNGQFRTPRHIIRAMVEMTRPTPQDTICDPACGTAGFLVGAVEYLREHHEHDIFADPTLREHFENDLVHGFDFDETMLRVAAMNLLLHGVPNPDVRNKDSLASDHKDDEELYSLVLANPPFTGSLDMQAAATDLLKALDYKPSKNAKASPKAKTELLFLALILRLLKTGGRAAVVVPDGVLFGSTGAHKKIRETIVEHHKLEAVVSLPSGVFKPYTGVSCGILLFTKTGRGGTGDVWFYDLKADGFSLDDKRQPVTENDIPDLLRRWQAREDDRNRARTDQSFFVPKAEIVENSYDLSLNRYKKTQHAALVHRTPREILGELETLEADIQHGLRELEEMLA